MSIKEESKENNLWRKDVPTKKVDLFTPKRQDGPIDKSNYNNHEVKFPIQEFFRASSDFEED